MQAVLSVIGEIILMLFGLEVVIAVGFFLFVLIKD